MGKSRRHKTNYRKDEVEHEREEKILAIMRESGRSPTSPGGHFHDTDERPGRRDRSSTKRQLRDVARDHNHE